jgi:hypothetical protein
MDRGTSRAFVPRRGRLFWISERAQRPAGFAQMSFGAVVTLIVAVCHDGSALPVAIVLVTAAAAGQLALLKA